MHNINIYNQLLYSISPLVFSSAKNDEGSLLFCAIRKKQIVATPEEVVRQALLHHLKSFAAYPFGLFSIERGFKYDKLSKRYDLLLRNREGSPFLLIECKAPFVPITKATILQASNYNAEFNAPFVLITNGIQELILEIDRVNNCINRLDSYPLFP